jgi:hypothetical protein
VDERVREGRAEGARTGGKGGASPLPTVERRHTHLELDVLVLQRLDVEADGRHGRDGLVHLEAVCGCASEREREKVRGDGTGTNAPPPPLRARARPAHCSRGPRLLFCPPHAAPRTEDGRLARVVEAEDEDAHLLPTEEARKQRREPHAHSGLAATTGDVRRTRAPARGRREGRAGGSCWQDEQRRTREQRCVRAKARRTVSPPRVSCAEERRRFCSLPGEGQAATLGAG